MTESEWWSARNSLKVVDWLFFATFAAERKFRLFAAACCRRVENQINVPEVVTALACVEHFADGSASQSQTTAAVSEAIRAYQDRWGRLLEVTSEAVACRAVIAALGNVDCVQSPFHRSREWYESEDSFPYPYWSAGEAAEAAGSDDVAANSGEMGEHLAQVHLLHDIFGPLPFRDIAVEPSWLTSDVLALARGTYENKAFDRMPILADALQDAGCDNTDILSHCRAEGWAHVRGCWVIDLLLGRPWRET